MRVEVELDKTSHISQQCRIPKPNIRNFSRLFKTWGLTAAELKMLSLHISFCNTAFRGEYTGCHNGTHHIELKDLYCLPDVQKKFLEEVTIHESRHVWWALQGNPLLSLEEDDCQKEEKKNYSVLWIF